MNVGRDASVAWRQPFEPRAQPPRADAKRLPLLKPEHPMHPIEYANAHTIYAHKPACCRYVNCSVPVLQATAPRREVTSTSALPPEALRPG